MGNGIKTTIDFKYFDPMVKIETKYYGGALRVPNDTTDELMFYYMDGPCSFAMPYGGLFMLFHLIKNEDDQNRIWINNFATKEMLDALRTGKISMRGALYPRKKYTPFGQKELVTAYESGWITETDADFKVVRFQSPRESTYVKHLPPEGVGTSHTFGVVPDMLDYTPVSVKKGKKVEPLNQADHLVGMEWFTRLVAEKKKQLDALPKRSKTIGVTSLHRLYEAVDGVVVNLLKKLPGFDRDKFTEATGFGEGNNDEYETFG